jgi:hypothetical protein
MTLIIHIFCSVVSLGLHWAWFMSAMHHNTVPQWLKISTLSTLSVAVGSGLLLTNGSTHSAVHSISMLGLFMLMHVGIYAARRVLATENIQR